MKSNQRHFSNKHIEISLKHLRQERPVGDVVEERIGPEVANADFDQIALATIKRYGTF